MFRKALCTVSIFLFLLLLPISALAQLSAFLDYVYLTGNDQTIFGEIIWFWSADTLHGDVHSNGYIGIKQSPRFFGHVSTTKVDFIYGAGYSPWFAYDPQFSTPLVYLPTNADYLREAATEQGHVFESDSSFSHAFLCDASSAGWVIKRYPNGAPPCSANIDHEELIPYGPDLAFLFEGDLSIAGEHVAGRTGILSLGDVRITDNLLYEGVSPGEFHTQLPDTLTSNLGIISCGGIRVANTWANGRGNGLIRSNGNHDSSHIVITSALIAMGESFCIEGQNDVWENYRWCAEGGPHEGETDERGSINLIGSLVQNRRGYVHRGNCGGTGYAKDYHHDPRFCDNPPPFVYPPTIHTTSVEFSDTTLHLTSSLYSRGNLTIGPGTVIYVESDLRTICSLDDTSKLFINGCIENPIHIIVTGEPDTFRVCMENISADGQGIVSDSIWSGMIIECNGNTIVDLQVPKCLQDVEIHAKHLSLRPHPNIPVPGDSSQQVLIERFVFYGETIVVENELESVMTLKNAEINGSIQSDFSRIERATFIGTSDYAIDNLNSELEITNSFFFGYHSALVSQNHATIDYSGYFGFEGISPFRLNTEVGEHMLESVVPLFVDPIQGDYHLQVGSPLIDAGDPESELDPDGTIADIGAYPFDQLYRADDSSGTGNDLPKQFGISSAYPNPFNPTTRVEISLPNAGMIIVDVVDILGRRVSVLQDGWLQAGTHGFTFDGSSLAAGTYFVRLSGKQASDVMKIFLLK